MADKTMQYKFVWIVCLTIVVFIETALATIEPMGELAKDGMERGGGVYIVGNEKIVLSREDHRIYINAVAGDAVAQCEFAKVLNPSIEKGDASPRVATEAVAWAMRAAKQGNADGENYVGMSYKEGDGVTKDARESEKWLKRSVEHGSAKAMCNLAILYQEQGNLKQAVRFARRSAVAGYAPGQFLWGRMNYLGLGTPVDAEKAASWFMKARKQGNINATSLLAVCYQKGNGVKKDESRAVELYEEVANKSDNALQTALAKVAIANIHLSSEQPNGKSLALKWAMEVLRGGGERTLRMAGLGSCVAQMQFIVGAAYYEGKCVKQNIGLANEWLEKARAGGSDQASAMLAMIAREQRKLEEQRLAAKKAAEEAEQRRREEEKRRIAEEEREERRRRREEASRKRAEMPARDREEWDAKSAALRQQYDNLLSKYDLTESLFSLNNGCAELILLGSGFDETYRIDYYPNGGRMTYSGSMPASIARQLVTLRMRIWVAEY